MMIPNKKFPKRIAGSALSVKCDGRFSRSPITNKKILNGGIIEALKQVENGNVNHYKTCQEMNDALGI